MSPTTLIAFRVRAPHSTRSVELYGSWDNFTLPYTMIKDLQVGSSYWSGCHSFENIICDGNPNEVIPSRNGGLKMGGTYWYYYRMDDGMDFHNVMERATTHCPLLPGQLVNVLQVPFAFSGNRSRNPSSSSTSSERRTMDPSDKFMHPRPAPARPEALRLQTSPTQVEFASDHKDSATSGSPWSSTTPSSRFLRLPKKPSLDSYNSVSGSPLDGLRAAFKLRTGRAQSPENAREQLQVPQHRRAVSRERSPLRHVEDVRCGRPPTRGLLLRSASHESISTSSFQDTLRQRSRSREHPVLQVSSKLANSAFGKVSRRANGDLLIGTVQEVKATEIWVQPLKPVEEKVNLDLEKRLPTLPNTPSSAYPLSPIIGSSHVPLDLTQLVSHFSATTIDTNTNTMSIATRNEQSHFSAWTTTTDTSSMMVDELPPPVPVIDRKHYAIPIESPVSEIFMPSHFSMSSFSSSKISSPSICDQEADFDHTEDYAIGRPDNGITARSQIQHYSLPEDTHDSQVTLKQLEPSIEPLRSRRDSHSFVTISHDIKNTQHQLLHSDSMQKLLDELSYLSELIQH